MKKVIYILLGFVLLLPFYVKAEETSVVDEISNYINYTCDNNFELNANSMLTCAITLKDTFQKDYKMIIGVQDGSGIQFSGDKEKWANSISILKSGNIYVKPVSTPASTTDVNAYLTLLNENDATISSATQKFTLNSPESSTNNQQTTNPTKPSNNSTTTTTANSTKASSKGIVNPNTSDIDVLSLSIISLLLIVIICLSAKKLKLGKR